LLARRPFGGLARRPFGGTGESKSFLWIARSSMPSTMIGGRGNDKKGEAINPCTESTGSSCLYLKEISETTSLYDKKQRYLFL